MKEKIIAVVGVNDNAEKFGYKIFFGLKKSGYKVFPVGVRGGEAAGVKIYKTLTELPQKIEVVITVVPPSLTEKIIDECILLGVKEIWMQPGSRSGSGAAKAREAGIKVTEQGCFMIAEGIWQ